MIPSRKQKPLLLNNSQCVTYEDADEFRKYKSDGDTVNILNHRRQLK